MADQNIDIEDWEDYDDRKNRGGSDRRNFACTEPWEVDYLIRKIEDKHPLYTRNAIRQAIEACCKTVAAPRPRKQFVECVMKRLSQV